MALFSTLWFSKLLLLYLGLHLTSGDMGGPGSPCPACPPIPPCPPSGPMCPPGPPGPVGPRGLPGLPGLPGMPARSQEAGFRGIQSVSGPQGPPGIVDSVQEEIKSLRTRLSLLEKATSFQTFINAGQKYYVTNGIAKNFEEGLRLCHNAGGILALPRTEEENEVLSKLPGILKSQYLFLGTNDRKTESRFVDTEEKPLIFFKWDKGEPNNSGGEEDCVVMGKDGLWIDTPCENQHYIVCELA